MSRRRGALHFFYIDCIGEGEVGEIYSEAVDVGDQVTVRGELRMMPKNKSGRRKGMDRLYVLIEEIITMRTVAPVDSSKVLEASPFFEKKKMDQIRERYGIPTEITAENFESNSGKFDDVLDSDDLDGLDFD